PAILAVLPNPGRLDKETAAAVLAVHEDAPGGKTCRACRFRYRKGARSCPSVVFVRSGPRAAFALLPADTVNRPCRACHGPVPVPAAEVGLVTADGGPLCESCQGQPSLFADLPPAAARQAARRGGLR
ncbi:hypothetical protein, partial [Candidatus Frankia nodulisporulans]